MNNMQLFNDNFMNSLLDVSVEFTGRLFGPDGQPISGARSFGITGFGEEMPGADFTVRGFSPHRPRSVFFQHQELGLVGVAQSPKHNGESITVPMQPGATVTGRLLDANGQPSGGVRLGLSGRSLSEKQAHWLGDFPGRIKMDPDGRFCITAVVPGYEYQLVRRDGREGELFLGAFHFGQTKDLGDVRLKTD